MKETNPHFKPLLLLLLPAILSLQTAQFYPLAELFTSPRSPPRHPTLRMCIVSQLLSSSPILQFLHGVVFLASKPHVPISYYFVF
ncbi:unnamed protein product [Prunus brigantina]